MSTFFKKDFAGISLSSKGIVITHQISGRIKDQLVLPYARLSEDPGTLASDDFFKDKEMEVLASLQRAIREIRLDLADIVVALPPRDLIIRFFEMPNIPKSEIVAGINFEMKKYIPFKIEELSYDFQYRIKHTTNIIEVILCGIRRDPLEKYINLFKQLNLRVSAFEPGLFSIFRLLDIRRKISNKFSYCLLEFSKGEANILIADKGFPYFTRDIKLVSPPQPEQAAAETDIMLFRLINEVRVSLDYYKRQFVKKDIDELVIVARKSYDGWLEVFNRELGYKINFIPYEELFGLQDIREDMVSEAARALGAALKDQNPPLVTLNLARSKERADKERSSSAAGEGQAAASLEPLLSGVREYRPALMKGLGLGLVILILSYGFGFSKIFPLERELAAVSIQHPPLLPGLDLSNLSGIQASENTMLEKERVFKGLTEGYYPFYKKMLILPKLMPEGIWLNNLFYNRETRALQISCSSFSEDEKTRSDNMHVFILNLKKDAEFAREFASVELKSYKETSKDNTLYLDFDVSLGQKK